MEFLREAVSIEHQHGANNTQRLISLYHEAWTSLSQSEQRQHPICKMVMQVIHNRLKTLSNTAGGQHQQRSASSTPSTTATSTAKFHFQSAASLVDSIGINDLVGINSAKDALEECLIYPVKYPQLFQHRKRLTRVLLYGPPGSGKTSLVRSSMYAAFGDDPAARFCAVSAASVLSSFFSESEKAIRDLFIDAGSGAAATCLFFDEIDSLCRRRTSAEDETTRRVKCQFLQSLDSRPDVIVVAATNRPWDLDEAVIRRFSKRILVPMPDESAREALFRLSLAKENASDVDYAALAQATAGRSGSDISSICGNVVMAVIREAIAESQAQGGDPADVTLRPLTTNDVLSLIENSQPSVSPDCINQCNSW